MSTSFINQNFTGITNAAAQLSELNVGRMQVSSIDGKLTEITLVGYAPVELATASSGTILNLNKAPGLPQATVVTDPNLLRIPSGLLSVSAYANNNGTTITSTGGATFDLGLNPTLSSLSAIPRYFDDAPLVNFNAGVMLTRSAIIGATSKQGTVGTPQELFAALKVNTAAITAGDMKVLLTFMALPKA
jgi:hypothetical protein